MENEITLDVVEPTAPATEPNFGPLDVIGTLSEHPNIRTVRTRNL